MTTTAAPRTVLGSWPADDYAAAQRAQRAQGIDAHVVMDLASDQFLAITTTR